MFGEGYDTIKSFTNGEIQEVINNSFYRYIGHKDWVIILFVGVICLLKAFATSITIQSGGNGGNLAPSLFAGGSLGFVFALLCTKLGLTEVPITNLIIVGMAGVMSGVMYAPLTAIFLIAESSSGYDLFIPLMIVSVISFLIAKWFSRTSPDLEQLADQGHIFTREHDRNLLSLLHVVELMDHDVPVISENASFDELTDILKNGTGNLITVLDENQRVVGNISLEEIRTLLFESNFRGVLTVRSLMLPVESIVRESDPVIAVAKKFDETGLWFLPVVNERKMFHGPMSKSSVLEQYRKLLQEHSG